MTARLSIATLASVHGAELPVWNPGAADAVDAAGSVAPSIVHIGVGAFARAHLGVYIDDLMRLGRSGPIHGVSLRSTRAESQMTPQDCLYSVTTREPDAEPKTRVISSFAAVETGVDAAIRAISDPNVVMVTVTATEKAYVQSPTDPSVDASADVPAQDRSIGEVLARALAARYGAGGGHLVIASLDNVLDNGDVLRDLVHAAVTDVAGSTESFLEWVRSNVWFPRSVVDRMVPATTTVDLQEVASRMGVRDEAAVIAEAHRSWVIESVDGLPPLELVGVQIVDDTGPYERRKLHLLNGPHSTVAYSGLLHGHTTIAEAVGDPMIRTFTDGVVDDVLEVAPLLGLGDVLQPRTFATRSLHRFGNGSLGHTCAQVGADGSRKIAQRLLPIMDLRTDNGLDITRLAMVTAMWLVVVSGTAVRGSKRPTVEDPTRDAVVAVMAGSSDPNRITTALHVAFGERITRHVPVITEAFDRLVSSGLITTEGQP